MSYVPSSVPQKIETRWLIRELRKISQAFRVKKYDVLTAEPDKLDVGLVVYADGSTWNPGSGEGLYVYTSGGWSKL